MHYLVKKICAMSFKLLLCFDRSSVVSVLSLRHYCIVDNDDFVSSVVDVGCDLKRMLSIGALDTKTKKSRPC